MMFVTLLMNLLNEPSESEKTGCYQIEVNVDDVLKLRYPFPVNLVPQKKQDRKKPTEDGGH